VLVRLISDGILVGCRTHREELLLHASELRLIDIEERQSARKFEADVFKAAGREPDFSPYAEERAERMRRLAEGAGGEASSWSMATSSV